MIATLVRSFFEQPDKESTWSQLADVSSEFTEAGSSDVSTYLLDAADDIFAFTSFPPEHWPKIRSKNTQERLNKEIRRRTDAVGIFPNRQAVIRPVEAILAEQTDEWAIARRYVSIESLKVSRTDEPAANDPRPAIDGTAD
jgi:transposase-like protein